jgi:hypothetical protein
MATTTPTPRWNHGRLARHYVKRITEDAGCFEDLLGITGRTMTENEYESKSLDVVDNAWAEYEGQHQFGPNDYEEARVYFVDDDLVLAITDVFRRDFFTCYHEHPSRRHVSRAAMASIGQRRLEFRRRLDDEEQGKLIRNLQRIRGVR